MKKIGPVLIILTLFLGLVAQPALGQQDESDQFLQKLAWMVVTSDRLDGVVNGNDLANIQALADEYYDDAIFYAQQNGLPSDQIALLQTRKADLHQKLAQKIAQTPERQNQNEADRFALDFIDTLMRGGTDNPPTLIHRILTGGADSLDPENPPSAPDPVVTGYQTEVRGPQVQQDAAHALTADIAAQTDQGLAVAAAITGDGYQLPAPATAAGAADTFSQPTTSEGGYKPIRLYNRGGYDAVVDLNDYWYLGLGGLGLAANGGNAQINLLPGAHQFCFQWKMGESTVWSLTGAYTILPDASDDPNAAQTVTIDTNTGNYSQGTCADRTPSQHTSDPPPADDEKGKLTPEEESNRGTHAYVEDCTYSSGESHSGGVAVYTFDFVTSPWSDTIMHMGDSLGSLGSYKRIGLNKYQSNDHIVQFTSSGWISYWDIADGSRATCTMTK